MKKLVHLKKWLTVSEAARHLSTLFGESISEADVLRLALDGELMLSVYFVNGTLTRCGLLYRLRTTKNRAPQLSNGERTNTIEGTLVANDWSLSTVLNKNNRGIWDLPMLGLERDDIEQRYQDLIGGPKSTLRSRWSNSLSTRWYVLRASQSRQNAHYTQFTQIRSLPAGFPKTAFLLFALPRFRNWRRACPNLNAHRNGPLASANGIRFW